MLTTFFTETLYPVTFPQNEVRGTSLKPRICGSINLRIAEHRAFSHREVGGFGLLGGQPAIISKKTSVLLQKWRARRDDFRTFLADFVAALLSDENQQSCARRFSELHRLAKELR
jgi:hypothetical protein